MAKENEMEKCCCSKRKKERTSQEKQCMLNRLARIEGQVKALRKMVEEDAYCPDILTQASAAASALNSFNKVLLTDHLKSCVVEDIKNEKEGAIEELMALLGKLMR